MSPLALMAAGYGAFMLLAAAVLEWLSAHTHRRSLRYRTSGFSYDATHDHWECPEGQHLWPHAFDAQRRTVRYRAKAHVCNGCPVKDACTDSDEGRELVRPMDPWPHSEAGRFHRGLSLLLAGIGALVLVVGLVREHAPVEAAVLGTLLLATAFVVRWLARDFVAHPANFPAPAASHGLRVRIEEAADARVPRSRWASQNRDAGRPR